MGDLQVRTAKEYDFSGKREVVRLRWRERGARRWNSRIVVPQEGQTVGYIMNHATVIAEALQREALAARQ